MAAVLSALAPYVLQLIKEIPEEELRMLLGVSGQIKKFGDKVANLEAYLADAERRRIDDERVQGLVSKLKGALYEATDILELCQLDAEERRQMGQGGLWTSMEEKAPGCLRPLLFFLRNPGFAHSMGRRIKELNATLDSIREEMADFRFEPLGSFPVQTPPSSATPPSRETTSVLDESDVVGDAIEADTNSLVKLLTGDHQPPQGDLMVMFIVGAGGMGKTTLAQKIFNDKAIKEEFRSTIWLSVTENYNAEKLLSDAIIQAGGEPRGDSKEFLTRTLAGILSTGKFLLVLDDVWSVGPWAHVIRSPVAYAARNQPGSGVIITTRNEGLVRLMGVAYHKHHVRPLCDEDAWSLLKKQLLPQDMGDESALDLLKGIGIEIIRKCNGLPLAIKAVGGLLRTKGTNEREWKGVLDNQAWLMDNTHQDLNSALRLSYEDLPPQLKQCFLYCSLFPKGTCIHGATVVGMWMSEGFIKVPPSNEERWTERDIGFAMYWDLFARNLIEPDNLYRDGSRFQMHDVIRSFAQYMAKEEAQVVQLGQTSTLLSSTKFRRITIESSKSESESMVLTDWNTISKSQGLVRSLIIEGRMRLEPSTNDSSLSRFPSLRALLVKHAESDTFVDSLSKLRHLRFLHLEGTDISRLPDDIGKARFLQHIHLEACANFGGELPSSILKLRHLRTLGLDKFNVIKGFGGLTNLESLALFPAQMDGEWCSMEELGPLSHLMLLQLGNLEAVPSGSLATKAKICYKERLRTLTLSCCNIKEEMDITAVVQEDCRRVEEVFGQLCPPPHLESLFIINYIGRQAPSWMFRIAAAVDFNNLVDLHLQFLPFCTQLPDGLCRLPSLERLRVVVARAIMIVGEEFQGQTASSSRPSFPRLRILHLQMLPKWTEWEWEEDAEAKDSITMPALQYLCISGCKLGRLPPGLASSRRLALGQLVLDDVAITAVENFPSVVELYVSRCPSLEIIGNFPRMQSITIYCCPALKVLRRCPALDAMDLGDPTMKTLPEYLRGRMLRILRLTWCHQRLHNRLLSSSTSEAEKLRHCRKFIVFPPPPTEQGASSTNAMIRSILPAQLDSVRLPNSFRDLDISLQ